MIKYKLRSHVTMLPCASLVIFVIVTFRMASSATNGGDLGDEDSGEKAAKLENLKVQKRKKAAKAARMKKFRNTVNPISMCVSRVDVEGLVRTRDDYVEKIVRKFFLARNYGEVIERTKEVHRELKTLGCFRAVDLTLDKDAEMDDDHLLIKIKVQELDRVPWRNSEMLEFLWKSCDMSTDDHNDARASWKCVVSNVLGRGESARLVLSKRRLPGLDGSLQFHSSRYNARRGWTSYTAELGSRRGEIAWRSLSTSECYAALSATTDPFPWLRHELAASISAREVAPEQGRRNDLAFSAREQCGYSMKTCVSQTLRVDTRDDGVLPSRGALLRWLSELSGQTFKNEFLASLFVSLTEKSSVGLSCRAGLLSPIGPPAASAFSSAATDLTCFRNPLQCRGWNNSAVAGRDFFLSEHSRLATLAVSAKLIFAVPFLRGSDTWLMKNLQSHLFLDYGAMGGFGVGAAPAASSPRRWDWDMASPGRWAQFSSLCGGIGFALRLGQFGRAELNYCYPLTNGKFSMQGVRFGIGVNVL